MSVEDINSVPDFNEYDPQDYQDLSTNFIGEAFKENALLMPFLVSIILVVVFVTFIYYIILILKNN